MVFGKVFESNIKDSFLMYQTMIGLLVMAAILLFASTHASAALWDFS